MDRFIIWKKFSEEDAMGDEEDTDEDEDAGWSSAAANRLRHGNMDVPEDCKALCTCGHPLRRVAKAPSCAMFLVCGRVRACQRCDEDIDVGVMYFGCPKCPRVQVCKSCGPGVFIERKFEYVDRITDERRVAKIPSKALHERQSSAMLRQAHRSRGVDLDGPAQKEARPVAEKVLNNVKRLVKGLEGGPQDIYDHEWQDDVLLQLFGAFGVSDVANDIQLLNLAVREIMQSQGTVSEATVPCKVFGDIHGQARDLLLLFSTFGMPGTKECPSVVFNGDFVDRGQHQLEVLSILFALKVAFPSNVWLNRGNHEDKVMNSKYGFERSCTKAFGENVGEDIFDSVSETFSWLPLACVIGKKVLAVHGGIGDGKWLIKDLKKVRRPLAHRDLQEPSNQFLWNILWSDPIEDDSGSTENEVFGLHKSPRSKTAVRFGWNVTQKFCATNGLDLIIRSHQAKKGGLGFDVMHNEMLIRVFSARDYESNFNDGAVLHLSQADTSDGDTLTVRSQVLCSVAEKPNRG